MKCVKSWAALISFTSSRARIIILAVAALSKIVSATAYAIEPASILIDASASRTEQFAARELQRYIYLTSGDLLTIRKGALPPAGEVIVISNQSHPLSAAHQARELKAQEYHLSTAGALGQRQLWVTGGDDIGTLYGVYRVAEHLGLRFYLDQDVAPRRTAHFSVPSIDENRSPLFSVRGIQPFHDFAEGPDWWNTDDYLAIIGQLPKLGMNFIGLHTYPEGGTGPEPTVWIGQKKDETADGKVIAAYPAAYHTTGRGGRYWWTYAPLKTSTFTGGSAQLYDRDDYGSDVMRGNTFEQQTPLGSIEVFNRTGEMLRAAFKEAHELGVLTCIGTETPLTLPTAVKARAGLSEVDFKKPDWARTFYTGMFARIQNLYPVDYYWLWTTESWTWEGNKPEEFAATANDIKAALGALADLHSPITLATCGWVLGPQHDRAALDKLLPPKSPMSVINRQDGHDPIDRQFANLSDRPRWAIPWLENDPFLISPQLWAGRMLYDGADARRLGQTGLIGIHWRTGVTEPDVAAIALAGWDQSWTPKDFETTRLGPQTASGAVGGHPVPATVQTNVEPTASARVGASVYEVLIPNGNYTVTLGFSELEKKSAGQRVFNVKLQGRLVVPHLDLAATGKAQQTFVFEDTPVHASHLLVEFVPETGEPEIASIEIVGHTEINNTAYTRRINCGGDVYKDFEADYREGTPRPADTRSMPVDVFYRDFAKANFGENVADSVGAIFVSIDGRKLPEPCNWIDGPGDILRNPIEWKSTSKEYAFVDQLESLRSLVNGAANLDRYDYWLNQFRALRLIGELGCEAGSLDQAIDAIKNITDPSAARARAIETALPIRLRLARLWEQLMRTEIAGVRTTGELGTISNLEQRTRTHQHLLDKQDDVLVKILGHALPPAVNPTADFQGEPKIIVTTVRRFAPAEEKINLRVLLVGKAPPQRAGLYWRPLGKKEYQRLSLEHVARAMFQTVLPSLSEAQPAIEYHIEAELDGRLMRWPVEADQTVILY